MASCNNKFLIEICTTNIPRRTHDMCVDSNDNIFILDSEGIMKITRQGEVTRPLPWFDQYKKTVDKHVNGGVDMHMIVEKDELIFSDSFYQQINVVSLASPHKEHFADEYGGCWKGYNDGDIACAAFNHPRGVCVHPVSGDIIVADSYNHKIRRINRSTNMVDTLVDGETCVTPFKYPINVRTNGDGDIVLFSYDGMRLVPASGPVVSLKQECWFRYKRIIDSRYHPDGYFITILGGEIIYWEYEDWNEFRIAYDQRARDVRDLAEKCVKNTRSKHICVNSKGDIFAINIPQTSDRSETKRAVIFKIVNQEKVNKSPMDDYLSSTKSAITCVKAATGQARTRRKVDGKSSAWAGISRPPPDKRVKLSHPQPKKTMGKEEERRSEERKSE